MANKNASNKIALLEGDGIGPEISEAVVQIFSKLSPDLQWEKLLSGEQALKEKNSPLPTESVERVRALGIAIKGPTGTPIGKGHNSANVTLRKSLDLFANVRPIRSIPGVPTPYPNVDFTIVRENTEDLYAAIEYYSSPQTVECLKVLTRPGCERIIRYAFELAKKLKRTQLTCVHKANIMKLTDGMFLDTFREISKQYSNIEAKDVIVDNMCMQLVTKPEQFQMVVTLNLYGDIVSDLGAGLIGGLGVAAGANIGSTSAVFEAVHGTAPDIAGKGMANPTALLLSSIMMLEHLDRFEEAERLRKAIFSVLEEGKVRTRDLKGSAGTQDFTNAIIQRL